ncbi:MAG: hypothetical protein C5B55_14680 [Blastocatellia bacterium]|nr:MAG: hypothetical protein C5B55_14680 [Blastocatellia bacterium]
MRPSPVSLSFQRRLRPFRQTFRVWLQSPRTLLLLRSSLLVQEFSNLVTSIRILDTHALQSPRIESIGSVERCKRLRKVEIVFALILDSLGSTELAFILIVALIFFGPRRLPQLARSVGKSLAEFRKASEDFKRTWEREVALESSRLETENSISGESAESPGSPPETQFIEPVAPEAVVARQTQPLSSEPSNVSQPASATEPLRKHDWL